MLIQESYFNETEGYGIGESDIYEPYHSDNIGALFRDLQKEYGACVSSVYIDRNDGSTQRIGWVFQRQERYEDTGEPYLRSVWVTLHEKAPDTVVTQHLASL